MARWMVPVLAALLLPMSAMHATAHEGGHEGGNGGDGRDVCIFTKHGRQSDHAANAKPANPGGGGGGGGKRDSCSKTYAKWNATTLDVYVNSANGPSAIDATTFEAYVQNALNEWSCHSGLGESVTLKPAAEAAQAGTNLSEKAS